MRDWFHVCWAALFRRALAGAAAVLLLAAAEAAMAQEMSLDQALSEFALRTGIDVVYDSDLTAGKRAGRTSAEIPPRESLRQLLAGSGLSVRFTSRTSATIHAEGANADVIELSTLELERAGLEVAGPAVDRRAQLVFVSALRRQVQRTLMQSEATAQGNYAATLRLWVDTGGDIGRVEVTDISRGAEAMSGHVVRVLAALTLDQPPPPALSAPLTLRVRVRTL